MGESVSEASRDFPVPPNGSSMTSIKNEVQSDKLTSEKLQEIEDEEILDKMVLYFSCCYRQISTYQRTDVWCSCRQHRTQKWKLWVSFLVLLNTKEDILRIVGNQIVVGSYWFPQYGNKIQVSSYHQSTDNFFDRMLIFGWTISLNLSHNIPWLFLTLYHIILLFFLWKK